MRDVAGNVLSLTGSQKTGWKVRSGDGNLSEIYLDKESAELDAYRQNCARAQISDALHGAFCGNKRLYKDADDGELRRLRSYHRPDRGNADGDQRIYQAVVEELNHRRA